MIQTIAGFVILVTPFCLVLRFENKIRGFLYIFTGVFFFNMLVGFVSQYFGFFNYTFILLTATIASIACLIGFLRLPPVKMRSVKINWLGIFAGIVIFYELFSVHYYYTGIVSTIDGFDSASHAAYQYPYFSDEWVGVALTDYSIKNHSLPLANPFEENKPYQNLLVCFFSLVAEILLLLGLNPLTGYAVCALGVGLLASFLVYLNLRAAKAGTMAALFAAMCVPLIVNGANLPGIWFLLPFIGGLILFLASLMALSLREKYLFIVTSFLSLVLYPPMIVFVAPAVFFEFLKTKGDFAEKKLIIISTVISIAVIASIFAIVALYSPGVLWHTVSADIFRTNLIGGIPSFAIWNVIPAPILLFTIFGIIDLMRKRTYAFLWPLSVGFVFWIAYAFTEKVFIIDYPRIVDITSFLCVICAGFGFDAFIRVIASDKNKKWLTPIALVVCIAFISAAVPYPSEAWGNLLLHTHSPTGDMVVAPASPIGEYLTADDLRLFSGITGQRFIASPWKGLVIAAATGNYPLDSKPATIAVSDYDYDAFMALSCADKTKIAGKLAVGYVYGDAFSCPGFRSIGFSTEGLYLYQDIGYNIKI